MISPSPRLLAVTAALGLPLALLHAVLPELLPVWLGVAALAAAGALLDAAAVSRRFRGLRVSLPELARLTVDRDGAIAVTVCEDTGAARALELALALPGEFECPAEVLKVSLAAHQKETQVDWPCTPRERGRFTLEGAYLRLRSPLGLWMQRRFQASACEMRVYPNLLAERTNLAALFMNRGMAGLHAQRQVGKGKEFEKLREYTAGDSYEDIHWRATAKRAFPVTKEFQIERTQEIYVIIDASRLSARPVRDGAPSPNAKATPANQLERFVTAALVLGLVAQKQGDIFGLATFSDQVDTFVRAKSGQSHHRALRDSLYTLQPKRVNPDFSEICTFLRLRLRRRALLFFLTNLDDEVLAESFARDIRVLSKQHIVLANTMNLPGVEPVFTRQDTTGVEDVYRQLAGHLQWHKLRETQRVLRQYGVTLSLLDSATACPQLVTQYMNVKRRQTL